MLQAQYLAVVLLASMAQVGCKSSEKPVERQGSDLETLYQLAEGAELDKSNRLQDWNWDVSYIPNLQDWPLVPGSKKTVNGSPVDGRQDYSRFDSSSALYDYEKFELNRILETLPRTPPALDLVFWKADQKRIVKGFINCVEGTYDDFYCPTQLKSWVADPSRVDSRSLQALMTYLVSSRLPGEIVPSKKSKTTKAPDQAWLTQAIPPKELIKLQRDNPFFTDVLTRKDLGYTRDGRVVMHTDFDWGKGRESCHAKESPAVKKSLIESCQVACSSKRKLGAIKEVYQCEPYRRGQTIFQVEAREYTIPTRKGENLWYPSSRHEALPLANYVSLSVCVCR